jgi:hypothetical protein
MNDVDELATVRHALAVAEERLAQATPDDMPMVANGLRDAAALAAAHADRPHGEVVTELLAAREGVPEDDPRLIGWLVTALAVRLSDEDLPGAHDLRERVTRLVRAMDAGLRG